MANNNKPKNYDKHIRINSEITQKEITYLCEEYHKTESHIINEALRFGLPLLKEHLATDGGIKPTSDVKFQEIIDVLTKVMRRLNKTLDSHQENNILLLLIQAQNEVIMSMVSSIYQRQKLAWSYENGYPEISELIENQMDFTIPHQYKRKLDEYRNQVLATIEEEGDE